MVSLSNHEAWHLVRRVRPTKGKLVWTEEVDGTQSQVLAPTRESLRPEG